MQQQSSVLVAPISGSRVLSGAHVHARARTRAHARTRSQIEGPRRAPWAFRRTFLEDVAFTGAGWRPCDRRILRGEHSRSALACRHSRLASAPTRRCLFARRFELVGDYRAMDQRIIAGPLDRCSILLHRCTLASLAASRAEPLIWSIVNAVATFYARFRAVIAKTRSGTRSVLCRE